LFMADNYIENSLEKYEIRKQAYLKKRKHLPKSMSANTYDTRYKVREEVL